MNDYDTIIKGMARALFVCAWADNEEEEGRDYPGQDLMNIAPETPQYVYNQAWRLAGRIEEMNQTSLWVLCDRARRADCINVFTSQNDRQEYLKSFGHYLAMQSLGHGVSWFDDHEEFDLKLPYFEFYLEDD